MKGLLVLAALYAVAKAAGSRTLVIVDNLNIKNTHSAFFQSLTDRGHVLTFYHCYDEDLRLEKFGEYFYDNLVLFAPTCEDFGEQLSPEGIVKFVDSGHNVLVAVNSQLTEPLRDFASECGIEFDETETAVIDHVNFDAADSGLHTLVASSNLLVAPALISKSISAPILFHGIGHAAADNARLIYKVLTGSSSTYSALPDETVREYPESTGKDTLLVSAIQTRNNARVVFSGSLDLFSNKFFASSVNAGGKTAAKSGNEDLSNELSQWAFNGRALLRAGAMQHQLASGEGVVNPLSYRVKDEVKFWIQLEEWDVASASWKPFLADDVQLALVMIDPFILTTLKHDAHGKYSTTLVLPDVYGVFKFVLNYHRLGVGNIELASQVSVHPYRHDQFERFIDVAFPYYASSFSMMAGFFIFGLVFLYGKDK